MPVELTDDELTAFYVSDHAHGCLAEGCDCWLRTATAYTWLDGDPVYPAVAS